MENLSNSQLEHHHSTYQLLVESEEKVRNVVEDFVYLLLILAMSAGMWQFSHQPVTFTRLGRTVEKTTWAAQGSLRG